MQCASAIGADKLIMFSENEGICDATGRLIRQCTVGEAAALEVPDPDQATPAARRQGAACAAACRAATSSAMAMTAPCSRSCSPTMAAGPW